MPEPTFSQGTEAAWEALPLVHREQDRLQDAPGPLPALAAATNWITSPNGGGTDRWVPEGGAPTVGIVNGVLRATAGASGGVFFYWGWHNPYAPAEPGQQWTLTAEVRLGGGASGITQYITAQNGPNGAGQIDAPALAAAVPADGQWHPVRFTRAAMPAGTTYAALCLGFTAAAAGDYLEVRHAMLTQTTDPLPYFDGDTVGDARYADPWSWAGTPNASESLQAARDADPGGYPMKRFLSSMGDQVGDVMTLIGRIDYAPPDDRDDPDTQTRSDLADADYADAAWLPWLAQLIGLGDIRGLSDAARRAAIKGATSGFRGGTKSAIARAVQPVLTGTQSVAVYDHSIARPNDGGGEWDVLVVTRGSETPGGSQSVIDAAKPAKPVGVIIHHTVVDVTWATLMAQRPTWASWNNQSWTKIQETGL